VMKPATLGFVVPGMQLEYGLTTNRVALFPLVALTGTTIGSVLWGVLADRIGRRAAILLASVMFMATSICGFMPSFGWNLFMCLIMGMSAGGMLPIVYALMAESIPAKKRGWLVVLHGGLGSVGGYLVAAGLATYFEPIFTWRILWLAGLPTGLLVLVLNRWIPESPRFLLAHGRVDEAERLMRRYGIDMRRAEGDSPTEDVRAAAPQPGISSLLRAPYLQHTVTVMSYGLGWGLVNWGFLTFMPTMLRARGLGAADANRMLFLSALIAVPSTLLVAYLYGVWSTKKTMILFALLTALTLIGFSAIDALGDESGRVWLVPLTVLLLVGSGGVISMLSPYTAEVYPTRLRGTGSGLAAGSSKIGGIIAPPLVALVIGAVPGFSLLGLVIAAPVAASALILALTGVETRQRALEEVTHSASPAAGGAGYD
jgi:putative MFS transporter